MPSERARADLTRRQGRPTNLPLRLNQ